MRVPFRKGYIKKTVTNTYTTATNTTYTVPLQYLRPRLITRKISGSGGIAGHGAGRFLNGNVYIAGAGGGGGGHGQTNSATGLTTVILRGGTVLAHINSQGSGDSAHIDVDGVVQVTRVEGGTGGNATPGNPSTVGSGGGSDVQAGSAGSGASGTTGGVGGAGGAKDSIGEGTKGDGGHGGAGQNTDGTGLDAGRTSGSDGWITYTIEYLA